MTNAPTFERVLQPYVDNLRLIGVPATIRLVDAAQYQARLDGFDFDAVGRRFSLEPTPGEGIRQLWSSRSADIDGSNNLAGIREPAIDALVEKLIHAESREVMTTTARALDRVLRAGRYWVPNWYKPVPHHRPVGRIWLAGNQTPLRVSRRDHLVVRRGKGGKP